MVTNTQLPEDYRAVDPDVERMVQLREGNDAAFDELLFRYGTSVRRYLAHRLNDYDRAEDLTQDVFLRVFRARHSYVPRSRFATWLFTIVNNVASNARRSLGNRREYAYGVGAPTRGIPFDTLARVSASEQPPQMLERAEDRMMVHRAVESLNERQRTAVRLCKFEGCSYSEVAERMAITPEAVKSLLNRARVNLRSRLDDYVTNGSLPAAN